MSRGQHLSRRAIIVAGLGLSAATIGGGIVFRRRLWRELDRLTAKPSFTATPPLVPHDPVRDRTRIAVAKGEAPAVNLDAVLARLGGIEQIVGRDDVVVISVSGQWWNQGMTSVAAIRRMVEQVMARPGFRGAIAIVDDPHFVRPEGGGLARGWMAPSARNVDVGGWSSLGDLIPWAATLGVPVHVAGLVDAGAVDPELVGEAWGDAAHAFGRYGGDGRGPIAAGDDRDGFAWDLDDVFQLKRSWVGYARTPTSWPRFTAGDRVIDLREGVLRREGGALVAEDRPLTLICMTPAVEHPAIGFAGAAHAPMALVDLSAGVPGLDPRVAGYQAVDAFGAPRASWRMAGPLAHWCAHVRKPALYVTCAAWIGVTPRKGADPSRSEPRLDEACAARAATLVAGTDPVAIDAWCVRHLMMPTEGASAAIYDLDNPDSRVSKFLRYYRQVAGAGTLDPALVEVV